ncbi:hypothetical protein MKW98_016152 [Papaver atlanticum]|uniref:Cytochrome P450 n=1 Tax=Papaver atlanticum TaxID=357466 RepID=A0AAD4X7T9_9MAGN|nr:hypothetical protein MKW98_016152 [Papaver atlanticum]
MLIISCAVLLLLMGLLYGPGRNSNTKLQPPEAAGSWPIVGHLPHLVGSTPLFKTLANMSDKYGPIFMVRFGMHPTLVVSSWEMSKECFTTNDKFLASRPPSASAKYLAYDNAMFGFSVYGPYWREIRKISTLHLLTHNRLEPLKHILYSEIDNCVKTLSDDLVKIEMSEMFGHLILNVVLRLVVGKSTVVIQKGNGENYTKDEEEGRKLHKSIIEFFELSGASVASDVLPYLGWLDVDGQKKRMKKIAKEMDIIAEKWLEEHRQKRRLQPLSSPAAVGMNHDDETDFMAVLLSVLDEEKDDQFFGYSRDTAIKATCLTLILAATDTTSVSLTWALSLLLINPSVLRKAQDDLDTVVDGAAGGGEASKLDFKGQDFVYTPFGSGRRMCPGINFAAQTLHMTLARLLHAFDFDNESGGSVIDMTEGSGLTMPKVYPTRSSPSPTPS